MSKGFVHSVKVPRLYKTVAGIVQKVQENGASLKQLIYQQRHTVSCHVLQFFSATSTENNVYSLLLFL